MINKQVLPESFDFGMPSVELIGVGSKGLDKTAMVKRASAFEDVLDKIEKKANRTYLHVITTGAFEKYGSNANNDSWPGDYMTLEPPYPEDDSKKSIQLDGGLKKYHNDTYMRDGAVYQEHQTKSAGVQPSGEIIAARYNDDMQRGELLIAVDTEKWHDRLQKKAAGHDIYLSIGASVPHDTCFPKGTLVLTEYGYRPIEKIAVGDIIKATDGTWAQVAATSARYATELVRIHTMGLPLEIECTPNHPFNIVRSEKWLSCHGSTLSGRKRRHTTKGNGVCTTCGKQVDTTSEWVQADKIALDDYLKIKIDMNAEVDTVGAAFAYLCGMYLGDGCITKEPVGNDDNSEDACLAAAYISISASAADRDADILERIRSCFKRVTGKDISVNPESAGKNAYKVVLYDKLLMARIFDLCGTGSKTKHIAADIFGWSKREKEAFLAGYIDADGCVTLSTHTLRTCSINRGLALGIQRLMWSIGIPANCYIGSSEENARRNNNFGSYSCCYATGCRTFTSGLCAQSAKLSRLGDLADAPSRGGNSIILDGGYAYIRVNGLSLISCDQVMVYNLEVEGAHTYNAEGADVHNCNICGHQAKVASAHCDHFKKHRGQLFKCGMVASVMNDTPSFYDISGVNVPADKIAFVLRKMASVPGTMEKEASLEALTAVGTRRPMLFTKAATILSKLAEMEKKVQGLIEGDKDIDLEAFRDNDDDKKNLILRVESYPADEVIDSCNRKGMLLSPGMLFKLLGSDLEDADNILSKCDDSSCGDMSCMMRELAEDDDRNDELLDGSFDQHFPADLNLDDILNKFLPEFGTDNPAIQAKVIRITISPKKKEDKSQKKEASFNPQAEQALRKTYARYLISFAERNSDQACMNALMKIAALGK